ncbi:hypothetical protein [Mycolicibacterium mageritense]|nr:hypothetical protein [Mycolicibacterium mageritense]
MAKVAYCIWDEGRGRGTHRDQLHGNCGIVVPDPPHDPARTQQKRG